MDFTFPTPFSSVLSKGLVISMNYVMQSRNSSPSSGSSHPQKVSCSIPLINNAVPEALVDSSTAESLSSEDSRILYALRSILVLIDSPSGLDNLLGKGRGRGGGLAGRGRGRISLIDIEKEKAPFDCATETQLTIQRVLRTTNPRSEGA